jgi:hypothetical protein
MKMWQWFEITLCPPLAFASDVYIPNLLLIGESFHEEPSLLTNTLEQRLDRGEIHGISNKNERLL